MGVTAYGLDFSWGRPSIDAIVGAGYTFVCRYLSWDNTGKNLTWDEAQAYINAGLTIVSNWEYQAKAPLNGYNQGVNDAREAALQHAGCGGPADAPIYFSADWDVQPYEYPAVEDYYRGCAAIMGGPKYVGAYGGIDIIRRLFDLGLIGWGWQTYAWSSGAWDGRAHIRQVQNGITVGGADCDRNEAWAANYGGWGQPTTSDSEDDDMPKNNAWLAQDQTGIAVVWIDDTASEVLWQNVGDINAVTGWNAAGVPGPFAVGSIGTLGRNAHGDVSRDGS